MEFSGIELLYSDLTRKFPCPAPEECLFLRQYARDLGLLRIRFSNWKMGKTSIRFGGAWPIPAVELLEVSRVTIDLAESVHETLASHS